MNEVIDKMKWYYSRLQAMSVNEIPYRIEQKYKNIQYKKLYSKKIPVYKQKLKSNTSLVLIKENLGMLTNLENINLESKTKNYNVFNDEISLLNNILWHKSSQKEWPKEKYSRNFTFSNSDDIGEIRYTWEINRLQFLPLIGLEYKLSGDKELYQLIKKHFYNWHEENLFLNGVNWSSSMEIAIRAYQWLLLLSILKNDIEEQFAEDIINSIIVSIDYVINNLSKHSSANNHLIIEIAISSMVGWIMYPIIKQNWFNLGYEILQNEIIKQTHSDGVNKEQAVHYHAFVLDMYLQYNIFLEKINKEPINLELIKKMVEFIGYVYRDGEVIEYGDSDDAKIIYFDPEINYYKYILQLASMFFNVNYLQKKWSTSIQVKVLTGKSSSNFSNEYQYENYKKFTEGGYTFTNYNDFFIGFDTGELGFDKLAAHGHADALSIVLNYNNKRVFVDPGTYIYNINREYRDLFRSTISHNTLLYENKNQSEIKGSFLWGKKARANLYSELDTDDYLAIKGKHDGYSPFIHKREIVVFKKSNTFVIIDDFPLEAEIHFTLLPELDITQISKDFLQLSNGLNITSNGNISKINKSYSSGFMKIQDSRGLVIKHDFKLNSKLFTVVSDSNIHLEYGNTISVNGVKYNLNEF
ncbi:alginate lyase family protein [Bacillus sp. AFS053548]|uniref:alginate lyase family protein n=1 Tax=Bacillus sp. AFS053548 TaxID=2033505 RepID=UPI000BFD017C|nr:alginate lyase family protein [Bacillus sp. AFS053548]PGM56741.1 hypothetical protein CN946_09930 [Bacillus sp. AFS053548]